MIKSDKKLNELTQRLRSNNPNVVMDAITMLRHEDPFSGAIGLLVETYDNTDNQIIKNKIRDFFNDIKESSARDEVINEINGKFKQSTITMLVSSCWQSGLDYSLYITSFARAFNNGDYSTALECFTVIEEFCKYLPRESRNELIFLLEENKKGYSPEKSALMKELVSILG